jgi:hypothetical protein
MWPGLHDTLASTQSLHNILLCERLPAANRAGDGAPTELRESRRGSFRVLLTPLTYILVGDGAPTELRLDLIRGDFLN